MDYDSHDIPLLGSRSSRPRKRRLSFENRILLQALFTGGIPIAAVIILLWTNSVSGQTFWTVVILLVIFWLSAAFSIRSRVTRPLQTIANMVAALREEDYSFRARGASREDALGELVSEINLLSESMRRQHTGTMEAVALLKKVLMEIDVAVFTFDPQRRLQIVNRAGEQLLALTADKMLGCTATDLRLDRFLSDTQPRTTFHKFPGKEGRWSIQRTKFRENGVPHELLIISDLSRALREEERLAWQRLIRVLGHELNNSLAPIKSIAGTLSYMAARPVLPPDFNEDMRRGLGIIETRAEALSRFMQAYTKLARLPAPSLTDVSISEIIRRAATLENTRFPIEVLPGPDTTIQADPDQLEQLVINIVRNAVDASLDPLARDAQRVQVSWSADPEFVQVLVRDEGPGLLNTSNLFVPFFTTKPGGSGIGLALSRQIVDAHGGTITLVNRTDRRGCDARISLPLSHHNGAGPRDHS
jgi:nitrogen fixation/metabolism regulation signal transduction histidine kinase